MIAIQLRNVILPVSDMDEALRFWTETMGLAVKFRDGDRYAALDAGGLTVALAGEGEADRMPALSFKVDDVAAAVDRLTTGGATLVSGPDDGPHETRATLQDPSGNVVFVYASK